jgi:hypothetical protein
MEKILLFVQSSTVAAAIPVSTFLGSNSGSSTNAHFRYRDADGTSDASNIQVDHIADGGNRGGPGFKRACLTFVEAMAGGSGSCKTIANNMTNKQPGNWVSINIT